MNTLFAETPLKAMDPSALAQAIMHEAAGITGMDMQVVAEAIDAATFLHLYQTRKNRGPFATTPYVEHPLRNALRALRWGVTAQHVIVAILLHDTVEDCLERILETFVPGDHSALGITGKRELAYGWISDRFGAGAARIVDALTNPPEDVSHLSRAEKHAIYTAHVELAIAGDAEVFVGKFADFDDNAGGLHHNAVPGNEGLVGRLASKYLPTADVFIEEFDANPGIRDLVSEEGYAEIDMKLSAIKGRLSGLVSVYA